MTPIAITLIISGTWIAQDGIASVLYYLKRDDERWHFNHAVRVARTIVGIYLVFIGCILV